MNFYIFSENNGRWLLKYIVFNGKVVYFGLYIVYFVFELKKIFFGIYLYYFLSRNLKVENF